MERTTCSIPTLVDTRSAVVINMSLVTRHLSQPPLCDYKWLCVDLVCLCSEPRRIRRLQTSCDFVSIIHQMALLDGKDGWIRRVRKVYVRKRKDLGILPLLDAILDLSRPVQLGQLLGGQEPSDLAGSSHVGTPQSALGAIAALCKWSGLFGHILTLRAAESGGMIASKRTLRAGFVTSDLAILTSPAIFTRALMRSTRGGRHVGSA